MSKTHKIKLLFVLILFLQAQSSWSQKFSELIKNEAIESAAAVLKHPLYVELGLGTLPVEKFKVLVQQDDIYVMNYLRFFGALAKQESDPERKAVLEGYENEAPMWKEHFDKYYELFDFQRTEFISNATHAYNKFHNDSAEFAHISASVAAGVPCFTLWHELGIIWGEIANLTANPNHPYKLWVQNNIPVDDTIVKIYLDLADGYFERLGGDFAAKTAMLRAYREGVEAELNFAQGCYETAFEQKFSIMADEVLEDVFLQAAHHPLYMTLARETLSLDTFKILIQQDELYIKSFYEAFAIMAAKENDPVLKDKLTKNNASSVEFFNWHFNQFNFTPTEIYLPTTKQYADTIVREALDKPIGEGLTNVFACYTIWHKMGITAGLLADLENNPDHKYGRFVAHNDPIASNSTSLARMSALIDGYYERFGDDVTAKNQMFKAYEVSIRHELGFAEGIYLATSRARA
jgi:thiaminase